MTLILAGLAGLTILLGILFTFGIIAIGKLALDIFIGTLTIVVQGMWDLLSGLFWLVRLAFRILRGIAHVAIYGLLPKHPQKFVMRKGNVIDGNTGEIYPLAEVLIGQ